MKKKFNIFHRTSFQKKIYIYCFLLNLILLLACSVFFYNYTQKSLKKSSVDSIISNTSMLSDRLDMMITNADNTLKSLQTNETLLQYAKTVTNSPENYFSSHIPVNSIFKDSFLMAMHANGLYGSVSYLSNYYDNVGVCNTKSDYNYLKKEYLKDNDILTCYLNNTAYVDYAAPHSNFWRNSKDSFSIIRSMRTVYDKYGLLIFDFDVDVLKDLLNEFNQPEDHSIAILDQDQKLVYNSDPQTDTSRLYQTYLKCTKDNSSHVFSFEDTSLSCYTVSPLTGWTFILTSSTATYMSSMKNLILTSALLFFILGIVMSSFLFILTRMLVRPMNELVHQLESIDPDSNIQLKPTSASSTNEIVLLTQTIQSYLAEIYNKTVLLNESRRREFQAHYEAMEAQLNPHFLYNTLSVIGMTGLNSGDTTVFQMCSELASLLRYSLSFTGQAVELGQEIANAKSYLYIMKIRYENDFICTWQLDSSIEKLHVPKLIVQPVIENCFQHGFRKAGCEISPPWKIKVHSWCDSGNWYLSISDNGNPFDMKVFNNLQKHIQHFKAAADTTVSPTLPERQGYGLENTVLRLSIFYKGNAYFNVTNDNDWVTITIGGPLGSSAVQNNTEELT